MTKNLISNNLAVELHVPHFEPARAFYGLLGFEAQDYDPATTSALGYLVLVRHDLLGDTMLNFYGDRPAVAKHAHFSAFPPSTPRGYAVEITVPVGDVEALWKNVRPQLEEGDIAQPLETKSWGDKDFRVIDPYGFYVRFTELVDWGQV